MDRLTKQQRSKNMKAIKSTNTKIEVTLRQALWQKGVRYRKNVKDVLGAPDICIKKYKLAIFCDGDFWHGKYYTDDEFHVNKEFWDNKIKRNKERDLEITISLRDQGWTVLRFWEDNIKKDVNNCVAIIVSTLSSIKQKHIK